MDFQYHWFKEFQYFFVQYANIENNAFRIKIKILLNFSSSDPRSQMFLLLFNFQFMLFNKVIVLCKEVWFEMNESFPWHNLVTRQKIRQIRYKS